MTAFANDLKIVPCLNKIDLPNANPEAVKDQLFNLFEIYPEDVIKASAKTGINFPIIIFDYEVLKNTREKIQLFFHLRVWCRRHI